MNIQFMFYKNLKIGQICTATYPSKVGMIGSMIQAGWVTKISNFFQQGDTSANLKSLHLKEKHALRGRIGSMIFHYYGRISVSFHLIFFFP